MRISSRNTESFRELLVQAGASLLLATRDADALVVVRPEREGINTHFVAHAPPGALALGRPGLAAADAAGVALWRNLPAAAPAAGADARADACYVPRRRHVSGRLGVHDAGFDAEGTLWLASARLSCIGTLAAEASLVPRWRPPFVHAWDLGDRCHLAGLALRDGRPRYVSVFGATDRAGGWRDGMVSGGQLLDIDSGEPLAQRQCMPVSPRWHGDRLWWLAAGAGQLLTALPGEPPQVVAELPGFARGLAFVDRYALVGVSMLRAGAAFAGLPVARRCAERRCGVWIVDTGDASSAGFLEFSAGVHEIAALLVLPNRYPLLLQHGDAPAASTYEFPAEVLAGFAAPDPRQQALAEATREHQRGRFDAAIACYRALLADAPGLREAHHRLGLCLVDAERWHEAVAELGAVVAAQPDNAEAHNSLGLAHYRLGALDAALACFDRALLADPGFALAHFNRGLVLLKRGRYAEGWPGYDWRWKTPRFLPFQCPHPPWRGEHIGDRRLLVHSEQGNGDHIQFLRFLPLAAARCRELIYVGTETMAPLVARIPGVSESRVPGQIANGRFDTWCPLMSLPRWLDITLENLPAPARYLEPPPEVLVRRLDGGPDGGLRVGISWAGSPTQQDDRRRSMALQLLQPLFALRGMSWFSLQMPVRGGDAELLARHGVCNLEPELPGYARTAALVDQLDLVISVDTAIAHLAAALGKDTWILLGHDPDWRWLCDGERSPWYPTARLYRQQRAGDWDAVVRRVRDALLQRVADAARMA